MLLRRLSTGESVTLGAELGRGGEGAVHSIEPDAGLVAKVYHRAPGKPKLEKLAAMARQSSPQLLRAAAWPVDLLQDEQANVRGFLMPRIAARHDLHELYSPKSRKRRFPRADFRFVVHSTANLARAFALVHEAGHVIGDVNHGNALVGEDGTVVLIDCDSFQVRHADGFFDCDVGSPLFTPPELRGRSFRGLRRDVAHDHFGLAVLVFHLLYLGRHPFAGRSESGDLPIERAIAESLFAYGREAPARGVSRPPAALAVDVFGEAIAQLFERAFAPPESVARPTALEWIDALEALRRALRQCPNSSAHFHPGPGPCCWCEVEERSGVRAYGTAADESTAAVVARLWSKIESESPPPPAPPRPTLPFADHPAQVVEDIRRKHLRGALAVLVAGGGGAIALPLGYGIFLGAGMVLGAGTFLGRYLSRVSKLLPAGKALEEALGGWEAACDDRGFARFRGELEAARHRVLEIAAERERIRRELPERAASAARMAWLDRCLIREAGLPGIETGAIAMLESYGIEGADEVIVKPQTLGILLTPGAARALRAWAAQCEREFDAQAAGGAVPENAASDPLVSDAAMATDRALRIEEASLLEQLREGPLRLQVARERAAQARKLAEQRFIEARRDFMRVRGELLA